MADSRRELVLKAVQTALEQASVTVNAVALTKPAGLTVKRHPETPIEHRDLPQIDLWVAREAVTYDITGVSTRVLTVRVRSTVTWSSSAEGSGDEALDPLLTWAEVALMADETLGGVASLVVLTAIATPETDQRTEKYAQAAQDFDLTYLTLFGDPRSSP